ncbi:DUF6884 domain-containing protein [Halorussus sp. MSC15.2]|uniref:DUF6884 domain-containing protein n=1 Tax=Halorussus sp. MSC15.2 TaxID=2283638 RepID=UPI0013D89519|nr:DUF6884 domain-containing protein [Halorussus sp. MSC15.2]NEU59178.1 queuine tRNA-ribosyltransferase tRNA-guanine transglycosylase [Halorussus sp. MSC15.2]
MRFYVPEWDDAVDAHYDFEHDELSTLNRQERNLDYIWDIFERDTTPIDGVLISREQVEESNRKAERLAEYGVYDDPVLSIPDWLPTISDCGAWGYKSLPFPPYGNAEMLDFYETLEVTVGVTIDHLVLGSGKDKGRLYLDERAFHSDFKKSDIPDALTDAVDLMTDEWPEKWPVYVDEYEPTIRTEEDADVEPFTAENFQGDIDAVLERLKTDPRAVYRENDAEFRYELTLRNAQEMYDLYHDGDYPFRLMVAIQGWNAESYADAADTVLDIGYNYLGIGGVAGSPIHAVRKIVKGVGKTVKEFEREHDTRVDSHVFGFAKTEGFETVGRSGMTSFDSASMLRSAWTGGQNYRLDADERYDAIRVRYPSNRDTLDEAIEKSLRGRETLVALRAYAADEAITDALQDWRETAGPVLSATRKYLQEHRHDDRYDKSRLRDVEAAFRDHFEYARELQASFSKNLRGKLVKLLRKDDPDSPVPFEDYIELIRTAETVFEKFPRTPDKIQEQAVLRIGLDEFPDENGEVDPYSQILGDVTAVPEFSLFDQIWTVIKDYAKWIGDDQLLEEYQKTLRERPWEKCDCPICAENGVEVCIFRGNDRNRRRGFHNTRRFYDEFADELPKILVATQGTASLIGYDTVEDYLRKEHSDFWEEVHDLPVAEIGVVDAEGIREWWEDTPSTVSFSRISMAENLGRETERYQELILHAPDDDVDERLIDAVEESDCSVQVYEEADAVRESALERCGENYVAGEDFVPHPPELETDDGLDILIIDQCSGSKNTPETAPEFDAEETLQFSRTELLERDDVPGIAARDLYTGRQQEFVKDAVRRLEREDHDVRRYFISAGFGLVEETESLPPYEVTFSSMNVSEIRERSAQLRIREDLEQVMAESDYNVVFFTLGKDYYTSIDIDEMVQDVPADRIGVVFNRELVDEQFDNIVSVPARTDDAEKHGTIVVGLKGLYMENFARRIDSISRLQPETIEKLCRRVDKEPSQVTLGND